MSDERVIATIVDADDLIAAWNARRDHLALPVAEIDRLAGTPAGYAGKVLGPARIKGFGATSFGLINGALAVRLLMVEDPDQIDRILQHRETRKRAPTQRLQVSKAIADHVARFYGARGGRARKRSLTAERRREIARMGAEARWRRPAGESAP